MNVLVAKLMLNTESDKLQHLIKIQFVFNEVINGLEEANLKTMCNIALQLCESRKSKENECGGRESLERYILLYKTTVEGILTSPDKKYMELLYRTCSGLFRGLRPLLMVMDENIAILLETVVELLPQNGNLSRASVLGLNQKMAGTLSSNKLTVNISEKLLHANSELSSILEVHPDKIAAQAELLELNRLLIQAIRDTYPAKQLVGQLAIPLLAGIADIMIKFFGKMTRKRRIK